MSGDSISPEDTTRASEKNSHKPNAKIPTEVIKQNTANGAAFPGADTVGGTLPVPM